MSDSTQTGTQTLESYLLGPVLGIGTYGEVRSAIHCETGKQVALKMVDLSRFRSDTATLMLREVNIVSKLDHLNVIKVLDVMRDEPFTGTFCSDCACTVFRRNKQNPTICLSCSHESTLHKSQTLTKPMLVISQELAPGGELFSILMHGGALPESICRHYFAQLLAAIEHCHSREVIHRDIKPENIVFDRQRLLKLVDFGLAACLDDKPDGSVERKLSVLHSGVGSKPYSAPEVSYTREMYNATGYKGKPADIWSCAVVLFVMLTGRPPFYRPLLKTFNSNLVKCKHFARIIKGQGYEGVSPLAKDLLVQLFKLNPDDRLTIDEIRKHPWMTQPLDGPFGALPVSGVNSLAECNDVLLHDRWIMGQKYQNQVYSMGNETPSAAPQGQNSNAGKTTYVDGGIEYYVNDQIIYTTQPTDSVEIVARRRAYQHLSAWMIQRVRIAWDALQRPDMVYALETAFAHDEHVALQQAQLALQQQLQQQQVYQQQYGSQQMQPGQNYGGAAQKQGFQQQAVFGVPLSPVVLPNQGNASMQPLSISASNNSMNNNQRALSPSHQELNSLSLHNNGQQQGISIHGNSYSQDHQTTNSSNSPIPIPLPLQFPSNGSQNSQTSQTSQTNQPSQNTPTIYGSLSQQQSYLQQQRNREVAGTPLQQSIISSVTPGFSPASPVVLGKMGQSIPNFGQQYVLNNGGQLHPQQPQQQMNPQQQHFNQQGNFSMSTPQNGAQNGYGQSQGVMGNSSFLPQNQQYMYQQQQQQQMNQQQQHQQHQQPQQQQQQPQQQQQSPQQQQIGNLQQQLLQQRQQGQQGQPPNGQYR